VFSGWNNWNIFKGNISHDIFVGFTPLLSTKPENLNSEAQAKTNLVVEK